MVRYKEDQSGGEESLGKKKYTRAHLLGQKSIQTCGSESKKSKSGAGGFLRKSIFKFLVFCGVNKTLYGSLQLQFCSNFAPIWRKCTSYIYVET